MKLTLKKMYKHLRTIQTHRHWVKYYCRLAGIPWRGIKQDLSKYSPTEFFESARFWTGTTSPISEAKKIQGYSLAWLHHRGRNPHHWAYWADNFSEGLIVHPMPEKDFVEMVCDFLAAGQAYSRDSTFSYQKENEWWQRERETGCKAMNEKNKIMLNIIFSDLAVAEIKCDGYLYLSPEQLLKSKYIQTIYKANN